MGIICIELKSVKLFVPLRSNAASTLVTRSYQVEIEELIEIVYVFALETYGLGCENWFLKTLHLTLEHSIPINIDETREITLL